MREKTQYVLTKQLLNKSNRIFILNILERINLTLQEKEVLIKSELDGLLLEQICNDFNNWSPDKKSVCSYSTVAHLKVKALTKIEKYLQENSID